MYYSSTVRAACCPSRRHGFHGHLDHIPNSRKTWPVREECFLPDITTETVLTRLSAEERRLDKIIVGNGTLNSALAKELYEHDEDLSGYTIFP